ncbi:MAG: TetR/AcrR family transcriptional regulator [Pseudomonadota bacterium]
MSTAKTTLEKMRADERVARKDLIVDAAIRLFAQTPYHQVGMREIAAEAGLSAASIYRYFSDRDDLFVEALLRETNSFVREFEAQQSRDGAIPLEKLAGGFIAFLLENGAFFQMMSHFMVDGGINPDAVESFNRIERRFLDHFEETFRRLGAQENVRLTAHAFFACLNGILITFWNYPGRGREETSRHMLRLATLVAGAFEKTIG